MTDLQILKQLTGETDEALLTLLLTEAQEQVLTYTNRTVMIDALKKPVRDLAVIALNRIGTEGETGRSEAGETYSFDQAPRQIYDILNRYRLARVGGKVHEYKPTAETESEGDSSSGS